MALVVLIFALELLISILIFKFLGEIALACIGGLMLIDGFILLGVIILSLIF